ncbi:uncharacterized protein [Onthophagus taurus]|uniref:uncharacterized protein n=1 Tax=Onthophagus taurus TaxID=166361 RepID=UPI0039BE8AD4
MDDTFPDIYADLDQIDFAEKYAELQEINETHIKNIESLTNEVNTLNKKLKEFQTTQEKITRNLSELFKTAKAEIARKDRMIAELRKQVDDILFRRNNHGEQRKRPIQEDIGEQKSIENKRPKFEKNQDRYEKSQERQEKNADKYREKSHEKQESYHRRDYRDREKSTNYSTSSYRGDSRKYEYKDDYRGPKYTKYTERRSQDKRYVDTRLTNDNKFKQSRRDSKSKDIRDEKENKTDINTKNIENKNVKNDLHTDDAKISKLDLEAYVPIEKIEIEEGEIEENEGIDKNVVKKVENKSKIKANKTANKLENVPKKEKCIKEEFKNVETQNILDISENKLTSNEIITETLNSSAQELQNAINSIKVQSSEESINDETINEETLQSIVDPNDSSIITQGNCIKLTNNCNRSFRSRRKRVVITVTD